MTNTDVLVVKATGEIEKYSEAKVRSSIKRAGISDDLTNQVVAHVETILRKNITTSEIYDHIIEFLYKSPNPAASARYSLKKALMQLGPSGYPFEKFVSHILTKQGYDTKTNQILQGKCVKHEVDVIAKKEDEQFMIEVKFHNRPGARSDLKVALYSYARFSDLNHNPNGNQFSNAWLVTNTKVTSEALDYAKCIGIKVISWSYPDKGNLHELIEQTSLHPITALRSLSTKQKQHLLINNIVLCKQVATMNVGELNQLGFDHSKAEDVIQEAQEVCSYSK